MDLLKKAYDIAYKAHLGQYDKSGKEYINHPVTVASFCETEEEKIVALWHSNKSIVVAITGAVVFAVLLILKKFSVILF